MIPDRDLGNDPLRINMGMIPKPDKRPVAAKRHLPPNRYLR